MRTALVALVLVAACSAGPAAPDQASADDLTVAGSLAAQSFVHGTVVPGQPVAWEIKVPAADVIGIDVWPYDEAKSTLNPSFVVLGPRVGGKRAVVARSQGGSDARRQHVYGLHADNPGSYLVKVSADVAGTVTLRLWMQSSHAPRQEQSQVDLTLAPTAAAHAAIASHEAQGQAWTDAEVETLAAAIESAPQTRTAVSDAHLLWASLSDAQLAQRATAAQIERVKTAAAKAIGTPARFARLDGDIQAFALWWLGGSRTPLFTTAAGTLPAGASDLITQLEAGWAGARETARRGFSLSYGGAVYGWQAEWSASQIDGDGDELFSDYAVEWFDGQANWLGEQSAGATEPDDND